jgi:hypothetical protein
LVVTFPPIPPSDGVTRSRPVPPVTVTWSHEVTVTRSRGHEEGRTDGRECFVTATETPGTLATPPSGLLTGTLAATYTVPTDGLVIDWHSAAPTGSTIRCSRGGFPADSARNGARGTDSSRPTATARRGIAHLGHADEATDTWPAEPFTAGCSSCRSLVRFSGIHAGFGGDWDLTNGIQRLRSCDSAHLPTIEATP